MKEKYFCDKKDIKLSDLQELCNQKTQANDYEYAESIEKNIVIYDGNKLRENKDSTNIKTELHHCLLKGPGIFVVKQFFPDISIVDNNTEIFKNIIADEKHENASRNDHLDSPETHDRIWNSFEKTCSKDPRAFISYYCNPLFSLVSEAWLGPAYQITAQVNIIKPDGKAQNAHRDYHFGFQSDQSTMQFPLSLKTASQLLTLQGAIAHTDMPIESGPTLLLPFSQQYDLGYMAFRNKDFSDYFKKNAVQLPLTKGDAIFFNPALFHAGGENKTKKITRVANLIQTSVTFGKPLENINRNNMIKQLYPVLMQYTNKDINTQELNSIVAAIVDGYAFPTNLDKAPPIDGNVPESTQQLTLRALKEKWHTAAFYYHLNKLEESHI